MATSGSTDFILSGAQLVEEAFALIGVKRQEQPLQAVELQDGFTTLNLMVKGWQAQGLHLWSKTEGILFLDVGKPSYFLGPTGDEATRAADFINTNITTAAVSGAATLAVTDTAGMTALDNIGIQLDDGTRQWTTIVSVDTPTGLTITDTLDDDVAITNTVYTFTTILERPLRILQARRQTIGDEAEIEVINVSRSDYFGQVNKTSTGTPVMYHYSPQLNNGQIFVWQPTSNVNEVVRFTYERPLEDFDVNSDDPDFPIEWSRALITNLAVELGMKYNVPASRLVNTKAIADQQLEMLLGFDKETAALQIEPDMGF